MSRGINKRVRIGKNVSSKMGDLKEYLCEDTSS